jgi:hypothetical protein
MNNNIFGTDPHKLHRGDPVTSVAAAAVVDTTGLEAEVYKHVKAAGGDGLIGDEVRRLMPGRPYSSVTARFKALDEKGLIERLGDTRKGDTGRAQKVMRAAQ